MEDMNPQFDYNSWLSEHKRRIAGSERRAQLNPRLPRERRDWRTPLARIAAIRRPFQQRRLCDARPCQTPSTAAC